MRRLILSLTIAGLAAGALAVPVSAATVRMVDDDGRASPGSCGGAGTAFKKIQGAVNAAGPGDTILVCPGSYREQVRIGGAKDGLTLRSVVLHEAIIRTPVEPTRDSIVTIAGGAEDVTLERFALRHRAELPLTAGSGGFPCGMFAGVRVDGPDAVIRENHIQATGSATLSPCGIPIGVAVGEGGPASALVERNVVKDFAFGGIVVGPPGVYLEARRNTVRFFHLDAEEPFTAAGRQTAGMRAARAWRGPTRGAGIAGPDEDLREGITVFGGPTADIVENTVEGARAGGGPVSGIEPYLDGGIVVDTSSADVDRNRVYRSGVGIVVYTSEPPGVAGVEPGSRVRGNITNTNGGGILLVEVSGVTVRGNRAGANVVGLEADEDADFNRFLDNDARGNLDLDCLDETAGQAIDVENEWTGNRAVTDQPPGICVQQPPP